MFSDLVFNNILKISTRAEKWNFNVSKGWHWFSWVWFMWEVQKLKMSSLQFLSPHEKHPSFLHYSKGSKGYLALQNSIIPNINVDSDHVYSTHVFRGIRLYKPHSFIDNLNYLVCISLIYVTKPSCSIIPCWYGIE